MGDRLVDLAQAGQGQAEVVVGLQVVGLDFQFWPFFRSSVCRPSNYSHRSSVKPSEAFLFHRR